MLNNTIRYMLDNDLLCLDSIRYNKDIPIETNEELNDLELKLRKEIGFIIGRSVSINKYRAIESDFEEFITQKMRKIIKTVFIPIGNNVLKDDQLFIWAHIEKFDTYYFPNWNGRKDVGIIRETWFCPDPDICYLTNEEQRLIEKSKRIKMKKKHRK